MNLLISLKYFRLKSRISSQREAIDKPLNDISWKIVRLHRKEHEIQRQRKKQKIFSIFFCESAPARFNYFLQMIFYILHHKWLNRIFHWIFCFFYQTICVRASVMLFFIKRYASVCVWCAVNQIELSISELVFFLNLFVFWPIKNVSWTNEHKNQWLITWSRQSLVQH